MLHMLDEELRCYDFHQMVLGTVRSLKDLRASLADPSHRRYAQWTIDDVCYLNYDKPCEFLEACINDPVFRVAFTRHYPSLAYLLPIAYKLTLKLKQMHLVKRALVRSHQHPDKPHEINPPEFVQMKHLNERDRAKTLGLTVSQLAILESSVDASGFIKLTDAERKRLVDTIDLEVDL